MKHKFSPRLVLHSDGEACSHRLAAGIGRLLEAGDVLAMRGELGAGKTFFSRGICRGLGVPEAIRVTSPTFTFINEYEGRLHIYHLDLYRLSDPDEIETLPWREAVFGHGVAIIEWPERMEDDLPEERWDLRIDVSGDESRVITILPRGVRNVSRLLDWKRDLSSLSAEG